MVASLAFGGQIGRHKEAGPIFGRSLPGVIVFQGFFAIKSVASMMRDAAPAEGGTMKRTLTAFDLVLLGVGAIVGAGIFATIGTAAAGNGARLGAGPSLLLSFVITAVVCSFTALCYAELAALVPISGSAYTYAYASLGELTAWIIGWDLILEYAISNVAIAISWANYARRLLVGIGIHVPMWLSTDVRTALNTPAILAQAPRLFGVPIVFNALAVGIVAVLTLLVYRGIRESARVNAVIVLIKLAVLAFFVAAACSFVSFDTVVTNWQPFFPNGWAGTLTGSAIVFFSYVGFDSLSTVAEETKDPGRNVPRGILWSLVVCTALYLAVTAVFTGMMPYGVLVKQLSTGQAEPLSLALRYVAPQAPWAETVIALGAVIAQTAAILVYQIAQPRIFYAMARDGLLPPQLAAIHPRWRTPHVTTWITGILVGSISAFASIDEMVDLVNIGTLFAFAIVCVGVPILRLQAPERRRAFEVPLGPYLIPALGALSCVGLMIFLPPASWWRFLGWLTMGLAIYAFYGFNQSVLGQVRGRGKRAPPVLQALGWACTLMTIGLFVLPHDLSPLAFVQTLGDACDNSMRIRCGGALIGIGLIVTALSAQRARHVVLESPRPLPKQGR